MFNHALAFVLSVLGADKRDEKGASALEYAILVVAIAAAVTAAVALFASELSTKFGNIIS